MQWRHAHLARKHYFLDMPSRCANDEGSSLKEDTAVCMRIIEILRAQLERSADSRSLLKFEYREFTTP